MQQPTSRDLHVDVNLTNVSIGYTNAAYVADQIFPIVGVKKQSDRVPKYDQSHWFRNLAKPRAAGAKSERSGFTINNADTYYCPRFSFGFEIPDELRDNTDAPYNMDRDATNFVTDKIQMCREVSFVNQFMKAGVWGTDKVGAVDFTKFSDYGGSDPLVVITAFRDAIEGKIAVEPNTFVIGKVGHSILKWHPDLIDMIKYTQRGQLTPELIASLLEFERYLIGRAIQTLDPEGTAEANVTYSRIWGKDALMLYVPPRPSLMNPAAGYTFVWERAAAALQYIKRMRDEEREIDIIESNSYFAQKVTGGTSGLFMDEIVA